MFVVTMENNWDEFKLDVAAHVGRNDISLTSLTWAERWAEQNPDGGPRLRHFDYPARSEYGWAVEYADGRLVQFTVHQKADKRFGGYR